MHGRFGPRWWCGLLYQLSLPFACFTPSRTSTKCVCPLDIDANGDADCDLVRAAPSLEDHARFP